jgi:hypothetical protein
MALTSEPRLRCSPDWLSCAVAFRRFLYFVPVDARFGPSSAYLTFVLPAGPSLNAGLGLSLSRVPCRDRHAAVARRPPAGFPGMCPAKQSAGSWTRRPRARRPSRSAERLSRKRRRRGHGRLGLSRPMGEPIRRRHTEPGRGGVVAILKQVLPEWGPGEPRERRCGIYPLPSWTARRCRCATIYPGAVTLAALARTARCRDHSLVHALG